MIVMEAETELSNFAIADVTENGKVDVPVWEELAIPIETLPNLRRVDKAGKLFRSSRQDLLSPADSKKLSQLGIRSIVDFRSTTEYKTSNGKKIFDADSTILEVIIPKENVPVQKASDISVPVKQLKASRPGSAKDREKDSPEINQNSESGSSRKRYLINFFESNYVRTAFNRIPLHRRLGCLFYFLFDTIFCTSGRYCIRFFARESINPAGLLSSYIDIIQLSGSQICLALRILCEPANLPALVSCAHGKDRTGIVTAMVLALLGKSDDYIAEEYALSEVGLEPVRSRIYQEIVEQRHMDESFTHARRETMEGLLRHIYKTYGTVAEYLESTGFVKEEQETLIKLLQE